MCKQIVLLAAVIASLLFGSFAMAAKSENPGPEIIKLKMGKKELEFSHHKHQKIAKNQCWECHDKKVGKIIGWSEATAHKVCIPCHDLNEKGPVICKGCHKK
ncbi:MAG: cytochrome C [Geobacteraceae bacterium]|nr:cytochrome C [Geobacteraceae bacterium]